MVARELTKLHEEVARGSLADLCEWAAGPVKGEVVIVIEGAAEGMPAATDDELRGAVESLVAGGASRKDAVEVTAAAHGMSRRQLYNLVVKADD